jgi:hypothetical protein
MWNFDLFLGTLFKTDSAPNMKEEDGRTGDRVNKFVAENKSRYNVIQIISTLIFLCVFKTR